MVKVLILHDGPAEGWDLAALAGAGHAHRRCDTLAQAIGHLATDPVEVVVVGPSCHTPTTSARLRDAREDIDCLLVVEAGNGLTPAGTALSDGFIDFLVAPLHPGELALRVDNALRRRQERLDAHLYELSLERRVLSRTRELWEKNAALKRQFLATIEALEGALEAKHEYTDGHSRRVADVSIAIATELGCPTKEIEQIRLAAMFHDIGKIGIRDDVLNKTGSLTDEEFEHVKTHPLIAEKILAPLEGFGEIIDMIKYEHERYDGAGYPYRIAGEQIPLGARIIAVADAFDALTTTRSYRRGTDPATAVAEIARHRGTQFDPDSVDALMRLHERAALQPA